MLCVEGLFHGVSLPLAWQVLPTPRPFLDYYARLHASQYPCESQVRLRLPQASILKDLLPQDRDVHHFSRNTVLIWTSFLRCHHNRQFYLPSLTIGVDQNVETT